MGSQGQGGSRRATLQAGQALVRGCPSFLEHHCFCHRATRSWGRLLSSGLLYPRLKTVLHSKGAPELLPPTQTRQLCSGSLWLGSPGVRQPPNGTLKPPSPVSAQQTILVFPSFSNNKTVSWLASRTSSQISFSPGHHPPHPQFLTLA